MAAISHIQSCYLSSSKEKGGSIKRQSFIPKGKFAQISTKNVLSHNKAEDKFLEIMARERSD